MFFSSVGLKRHLFLRKDMNESVLLDMFCSICLNAIIALKSIYVFKGKLEKWVENAKCQMLYASETGCY